MHEYGDEIRRRLMIVRRRPQAANKVKGFQPQRLKGRFQDELQRFCSERATEAEKQAAQAKADGRKPDPIPKKFTLHNFRDTAITEMHMLGASPKEAAEGVGCTPETMQRHYDRPNKRVIAQRLTSLRVGALLARGEQAEDSPVDITESSVQTESA